MGVSAWVMSACMSYKSMRIYECMCVCMGGSAWVSICMGGSAWVSMRMGGMHGL